jgi:hypothetical protein
MRSNRAALPHVIAPPTRASKRNSTHHCAEYGSGVIVVALLLTNVYVCRQFPNATGVLPGSQSGI